MPTLTKNYRWTRTDDAPKACARTSYRVKRSALGRVLLRFCCPRGKWDAKRKKCRTRIRLEAIGRPRRRGIQK
jgi:hypothetical protein